MDRKDVLQAIIDKIRAKTYLEIGVRTGKLISEIRAPEKIAVDPVFQFTPKVKILKLLGVVRFTAIKKTSDEFFQSNADQILSDGIDVAFIDGLHTYEQSLKDAENCLQYLNPAGIIVMHDCNPLNAASAFPVKRSIDEVLEIAAKGDLPGWYGAWCGDVWKTIAHLRASHQDLEVFTLDLDYGIGIISKQPRALNFKFSIDEIKNGDYTFFNQNRNELLNLQPPKFLDEFLFTLS